MQPLAQLPLRQIYRVSRQYTFELTVELALTSGVRLLVCGNRLPFYEIAYELAGRVGQQYEILLQEAIFFARAETCIQLLDCLSEVEAPTTPLLVTDLLSRFYAEADHQADRQVDQLFFACQVELQRLSRHALVFVSAEARPPLERLENVLRRITRPVGFSSPSQQTGNPDGPHPAPLFPAI